MRPEILFPLFSSVTTLKGVGPKISPLVEKVAGPTVRDLLFLQPQSFVRRTPAKAAKAMEGEVQTFTVTIEAHLKPHRANQPWKIRVFDDTGFLTLIYFKGHGPHLEPQNPARAQRAFSGKCTPTEFDNELQ